MTVLFYSPSCALTLTYLRLETDKRKLFCFKLSESDVNFLYRNVKLKQKKYFVKVNVTLLGWVGHYIACTTNSTNFCNAFS